DSVEGVDMRDDALDLIGTVAEFFQRRFDRLVDDLEHAASGEKLVFYESNIGFNSGGIAIHQETDRAGGREDSYLCITVAMTISKIRCFVPGARCFFFQMRELLRIRDLVHRAAMQLDHFQHWVDVVFCDWLRYAAGT